MRLIAILIALFVLTPTARAAELIVFEQKGCVWCQRFDREIAPTYPKTDEGKRAPLRRVDIGKPYRRTSPSSCASASRRCSC